MTSGTLSTSSTAPLLHKVAEVVAAICSPAILGTVLLLAAGVTEDGHQGLWWALVTAAVVLGLPMAVLIYLSRRGVVETRYVRRREHRLPVYTSVAVLMGTALLVHVLLADVLRIPRSITVTTVLLLSGVITLAVVTLIWKVSAHSAMAAAFAVTLPVVIDGSLVLVSWVIPVIVTWARQRTRDHTYWQCVVGIWIGILLGGLYTLAWHHWL